jgi:hypothetical protein
VCGYHLDIDDPREALGFSLYRNHCSRSTTIKTTNQTGNVQTKSEISASTRAT